MSDYSDAESFKSAYDGSENISEDTPADHAHFPPEKEAFLLAESNERRAVANRLFGKAAYSEAIQSYDQALFSCPNYLDYELAILRSNIAACHLKLGQWKDAVESATKSLDCLEMLDPSMIRNKVDTKDRRETCHRRNDTAQGLHDVSAAKGEGLDKVGRTRDEAQKIRIKALLRRAKARTEIAAWSSLQGAEEDYKELAAMYNLSSYDRKIVDDALQSLPQRLAQAKEREMSEMMGKLKDLGNGLLKPFGLSTNNFTFVKDEKTGGYSMQFDQGK